tara:strand:+ start:32 stop:787 length:756 start_codon:yes stop_codon:yes gene_type:complete
MVEILVLSLIQGITEFLPVSSSSHLIVYSEISDFSFSSLTIDVSLHIGSFFAVLTYFRNDILKFIYNKKLFLIIFIASLPIIITGYLLTQLDIINNLRSIKIIGWTTIIFAIFLYIVDKKEKKLDINENLNIKNGLFIGIVHVFSLIPGVSRSGIAITAGRYLGFDRVDSAKISYLLSIPVLTAVSFYGIYKNIYVSDTMLSQLSFSGILLSFIFSYITIKYFLIYIKNFSMNLFVYYRILLGIFILFYAY